MAWLWSSWDEYKEAVSPTCVDRRGQFTRTKRDSRFENDQELFKAVEELGNALHELHDLGFRGGDRRPTGDRELLERAKDFAIELIYAGENLLLHHKKLATSDAAYGFLHSHDILEHWDRYSASARIFGEIDQLVKDTNELVAGYHQLIQDADRFLISDLELPDELEADFRVARDLFSVGFDDVGVLIASRGLEGVIRKIAIARKITLAVKGKIIEAAGLDIYDLIEAMYRIRWRANGEPLISSDTKALLHYLRALRNEGAHARARGRRSVIRPRETATVVAHTANDLWKATTSTRARLVSTAIIKDW